MQTSDLPLTSSKVPASNGHSPSETIYLAGRPSLKGFLKFVQREGCQPMDEGSLTQEWQAAAAHIRTLEKEEAGFADHPPMTPLTSLGEQYKPLLIEFLKDPLVQSSFNTVPADIAMVELDRLLVHQKHIDLTFVQSLKRKLGPAPDPEAIFRACLPFDHPHPPVKWSRVHRDTYVFMSPSNDLRFLGAMPLDPQHINFSPPPGSLVGVVGLAVGFGTNFLHGIFAEGRLILNNGSHRAYALRDLGITHVPCLVQHVSTRDEFAAVAGDDVGEQPDLYLKHPRPALLKDYFDPKLRKVVPVTRHMRQVTVKFQVDEAYVPSFHDV